MGFEINPEGGGHYGWVFRTGDREAIADSADDWYVSMRGCEAAIELVKRFAPDAPIVRPDTEGGPERGARLTFQVEPAWDGGWRWTLVARNREVVAASTQVRSTIDEVVDTVADFTDGLGEADINVPVCPEFTVAPRLPPLGSEITLTPTTSIGFGETAGKVDLVHVRTGATMELAPTWGDREIKAALPTSVPFAGEPHVISLDTALASNCLAPIIFDLPDLPPPTPVEDALRELARQIKIKETGSPPGLAATVGPGETFSAELVNLPPPTLTLPGGQTFPITLDLGEWTISRPRGGDLEDNIVNEVRSFDTGRIFAIAPRLVSAPGTTENPDTLNLVAVPKLSVPGIPAVEIPLVLEVNVEPLRIPSLLALFNHAPFQVDKDFGGIPPCLLVMVPQGGVEANPRILFQYLNVLTSALDGLKNFFSALPRLGPLPATFEWMTMLINALELVDKKELPGHEKSPKLVIIESSGERELERTVFYWEFLYKHSAEDTFGSALFLGFPTERVCLYNARNFEHTEGSLELWIRKGTIATVVESLTGNPPASEPPNGAVLCRPAPEGSFNNRTSSIRFLTALKPT